MPKVFRGTVTVEFDADAAPNKHELAGKVERLLNAGVEQFTKLGPNIKVGVVADYVRVPGPRAKKGEANTGAQGGPVPGQIDLEDAIAAGAASAAAATGLLGQAHAPVADKSPATPALTGDEIPQALRRAPMPAEKVEMAAA